MSGTEFRFDVLHRCLPFVLPVGAPITQEFADKIGAHGYAADAASAVTLARELLVA